MTAQPNHAHFARRMDDFSRLLTFDSLRRFVAVAEYGGFRQASRHLHIAQPSLSRSINELEMRLSARLFVRGPRGAELTPVGQILLKHAQILYADMRRAADEIASLGADASGETIVGANPSLTATFLPRAISAFSAALPAAKVYVVETRVDHLLAGVADGQFEIGLSPVPLEPLTHGLEAEALGEFPYVIAANAAHPLTTRASVEADELWAHTWILPEPGTVPARRLDEMFMKEGSLYPPHAVYRTASPTLRKALAIRTGHVIAAPLMTVRDELAAGVLKVIRVRNFALSHDIAIIRRTVDRMPPATRLFMSRTRDAAREIQAESHALLERLYAGDSKGASPSLTGNV